MRAPILDRRITLLEPRLRRNPKTGESVRLEPVEHRAWAARRDFTGREKLQAGVEFSADRARFVVRWRDGLQTDWRLRDENGEAYAIDGLAEIGRRRYIEILALRSREKRSGHRK